MKSRYFHGLDVLTVFDRHIRNEQLDAVPALWFQTSDVDFAPVAHPSSKNRTVSLAQHAGSPYSQGRLSEDLYAGILFGN